MRASLKVVHPMGIPNWWICSIIFPIKVLPFWDVHQGASVSRCVIPVRIWIAACFACFLSGELRNSLCLAWFLVAMKDDQHLQLTGPHFFAVLGWGNCCKV